MRVGRALGATLLCVALFGPGEASGAQIVDLVPLVKNGMILVSFRMVDAFSEDIERAIGSGLPVSFRYTVQLKKVRTAWLNQKLGSRIFRTTVTYDNLTKRHKVSLDIGGELVATQVVADPEEMKRFMTSFENLELFDASWLEPNGEYYLRVKGMVKERNLFLFIPWDFGSGWKKAFFTYLP